MRKRWLAFTLVGVFGLGIGTGQVLSQEAGDPQQPSQEEMQAWMAYMTPGEEHKEMASETGEWSVATKMWSAPEAPPMESTATAKFKMILGGRYQVQEWTGVMMGMPFEGFALTGFDNQTREYTSIWADSMGTGTMVSKGKRGEDGVIELTGEMVNPMGGTMKTRTVLQADENGNPKMEMFVTSPEHEGEMKMMELVYTRKGDGSAPKDK